jgi:hypothetical protein
MQGIPDQPLSKDGYAPTMMAYTGPGGVVAPQAASPVQAPAPSGPVPEPFTQAADHSAQATNQAFGQDVNQAAAQFEQGANQAANEFGSAANSAAKEFEKGFGSIGSGDMFGSSSATAGEKGAVGQKRGAALWWILGFVTCGLSTIFWIYKTLNELKAFTGNSAINPIIPTVLQLFFPPWGQVFHAYKMGGWLMEARQSVGLPAEDKSKKYAIWCFILGLSLKQIQDDLNELWDAAGGAA